MTKGHAMSLRRPIALIATTLAFAATAASAHPRVASRSPEAGSTVASPKEGRVEFTEELDLNLSVANVESAQGKAVATGKVTTDKASKALIIPLKERLKPGAYTVSWTHVNEEHETPGRYRFTVK
jgi:copper resistance protein C